MPLAGFLVMLVLACRSMLSLVHHACKLIMPPCRVGREVSPRRLLQDHEGSVMSVGLVTQAGTWHKSFPAMGKRARDSLPSWYDSVNGAALSVGMLLLCLVSEHDSMVWLCVQGNVRRSLSSRLYTVLHKDEGAHSLFKA